MERSRFLMVGFLALSICLNIYALSRIGDLSTAIGEARKEVSHLRDSLDHGLDWVGNTVENLREEARWISKVDVTPGEPSNGFQPVTLSWQVREYPVGASVTLYLREHGGSDFTPYPAESTGGGGFRITFDHTIQPEPLVSIAYSSNNDSEPPEKRESVVSESSPMYRTGQYEYYVTMTDEREMRTTELFSLHIKQEASALVSPVSVDIRAAEEGFAFDITVHENPKPEHYHYRLQGASLKVRDRELVVKEVTLMSQRTIEAPTPQAEGEIQVFEGRLDDYPTPSEVLLILVYADGVSAEVPIKYLMDPNKFL